MHKRRQHTSFAATLGELNQGRSDEWGVLASSDDERTAVSGANAALAELGFPSPGRQGGRGFWVPKGMSGEDIKIDHLYLGPDRGRCAIQISVRRSALETSRHEPPPA